MGMFETQQEGLCVWDREAGQLNHVGPRRLFTEFIVRWVKVCDEKPHMLGSQSPRPHLHQMRQKAIGGFRAGNNVIWLTSF